MVAGVDAALKGLHLRKLGQHLSKGAAALVSLGAWAFADAVVSLWKLQRQIPEWLYCVRLVLTGQTRHLKSMQQEERKNRWRLQEQVGDMFIDDTESYS